MRNLLEYPITYKEVIDGLKDMLKERENKEEMVTPDMKAVYLGWTIEKLELMQLYEEFVNKQTSLDYDMQEIWDKNSDDLYEN